MWPRFWQSLYYKRFGLLFILIIGLQTEVYSEGSPPGIIESLQRVVVSHKQKLEQTISKLRTQNAGDLSLSLEEFKSSKIEPLFLNSLFLHSENKYIKLLDKDSCALFALIESNLLKTSLGYFETIPLVFNNKKKLVSTEQYILRAFENSCFSYKQISNLFERKNLKKTIEGIQFEVPKTEKQCLSIHKNWTDNPYLPYLCKIPESIKKGRYAELTMSNQKNLNLDQRRILRSRKLEADFYKKEINFFTKSYLKNICDGIDDKNTFCAPYLSTDIWSKVINGEEPNYYLYFKCKNLYKGKKVTIKELRKCAVKLQNDPILCTTKTYDNFPSLYPATNCSLISKALNVGKLKTNYHDCPGRIDNLALTNIHRVLSHFGDKKIESSPNSCASVTNYSFAKLNFDFNNPKGWPLNICYIDKIEAKEQCRPYIPGKLEGNKLSEDIVITEILQRLNKIDNNQSCKLVDSKEYRPFLLEYKNGCFIIYNKDFCNNAYCPKTIKIDEEEFKGLTYTGENIFDYFPNNYIKQKFSAKVMLEDVHKLKHKKINNLTILEIFLKQNTKGIVHGLGCGQDILPTMFPTYSFNHCSPLPFIIDGIETIKGNKLVSIRTAMDDIHSPRLIPWNFIFNALGNYRTLSPLNAWNLYGIY